MTDEMRTVTADGWPYEYRAHIVETTTFGSPRWRYVIEKKWVHWRQHTTSRRFKTREAAVAAANHWLDNHAARDKDFV